MPYVSDTCENKKAKHYQHYTSSRGLRINCADPVIGPFKPGPAVESTGHAEGGFYHGLVTLDCLGKFFEVISEQGPQRERWCITGLWLKAGMFASQIELPKSLLGCSDKKLVFQIILFLMEPFYPEGMPQGYGISIDLRQLDPAAFADGEC